MDNALNVGCQSLSTNTAEQETSWSMEACRLAEDILQNAGLHAQSGSLDCLCIESCLGRLARTASDGACMRLGDHVNADVRLSSEQAASSDCSDRRTLMAVRCAPAACKQLGCAASFTFDGPVNVSDKCEGSSEANGAQHEEKGIADHEVVAKEER